MRLLFLSLNYAPEPTGIGLYSSDLAEDLAARGHEVSVVCANPHYPQWRLYDGYRALGWTQANENGVSVRRCPVYVPARPSGLTRIAHYASFLASARGAMRKAARALDPDLVLCVAPSLVSAPLALMAGRMAGAPTWLHVQDFEVEAAFATGNFAQGGVLGRSAARFEARMLDAFDHVSSISPEMCRKLIEKGRDPKSVYELRNWADLDRIRPENESPYRSVWGIGTPHVALYSGSIARKQGIETIVEAARALRHRTDLTFVICGNGPTRERLETSAQGLSNIRFHDLQPMERLNDLLNLATVHLLPQRADAADLVLPSKLANMLASGRPVVAGVHPARGLAREVEGAGLICEPEDASAMADAIEPLLGDAPLRATLGKEAAERAHKRWSRKAIIDAFEQKAMALAGRPSD